MSEKTNRHEDVAATIDGPTRRWRLIGWMLRHPNRATYVVAEFARPLSLRRKIDNAWFHLRHWNDAGAWRAHGEKRGLDDSCT